MSIRVQSIFGAAWLAAVAAASIWAGDISGPVTGYVFDASARQVRPVLGIPGASTMGRPLDLGLDLSMAAVAPAQDYLLAGGSDGQTRLVLLSGGVTAKPFDALHGVPARIAFSPRGTAAVLVNADTADVYTGLPGSPALARTLAVAQRPGSLAVTDDGEVVLAVFGDVLSVAGGGAEWKMVDGAGAVALVAFAPAARTAAVVSTAGAVALYKAMPDSGDPSVLAPENGVTAPTSVGFSAKGKVLVASPDTRTVTILDPDGGAPVKVPCSCAPTGLVAMGSLFRLNELSDAPLWLLDSSADAPRLFFVPVALQ